jgi:hypothetical protein
LIAFARLPSRGSTWPRGVPHMRAGVGGLGAARVRRPRGGSRPPCARDVIPRGAPAYDAADQLIGRHVRTVRRSGCTTKMSRVAPCASNDLDHHRYAARLGDGHRCPRRPVGHPPGKSQWHVKRIRDAGRGDGEPSVNVAAEKPRSHASRTVTRDRCDRAAIVSTLSVSGAMGDAGSLTRASMHDRRADAHGSGGLDKTARSSDALALGHVLGEAVGARLLRA